MMITDHVPSVGVALDEAATLPVAGLTALRALRTGGAILGRNVLITGATGGVGRFAVQLAVASVARVTAQVGRPGRKDEARLLGAHQAVVSLDELSRVIAFISTVPDETKGEDLAILARLVADGRLRPQIG